MRVPNTAIRFCVCFLIFLQLFTHETVAQSPVLVANYALQTPQNATSGSCGTTPNWALQLDGQPDSTRYFTLSSGTLQAYSDGTMRLYATFVNYNSFFPELSAGFWFNAPTNWSSWEAAHSPVEYLSFCGTDDNREQWTYANSSGDSYNYLLPPYNGFGWQNTFNLLPLQNDTSIWLQQGLGANGVDGEEGIAFEFGYNGSWQDVNGLDYALLQGVGRVAVELIPQPLPLPLYEIPSTSCGSVNIILRHMPNAQTKITTSSGDTLYISTGPTGSAYYAYSIDTTTVFRFIERIENGVSTLLSDTVVTRYFDVDNDLRILEDTTVLSCDNPVLHIYDPTIKTSDVAYSWYYLNSLNQYWYLGSDSTVIASEQGKYIREARGEYCYGYQEVVITKDSLRWIDKTVIEDTIDTGSIFFFAGQNYTEAGNYYDTLQAAIGCDSIVQLRLRVRDNSRCQILSSENAVCAGDEVALECVYSIEPSAGSFLDFIPDTDLWAYYTFDETLMHALGNTNSPFYHNNSEVTYPVSGAHQTPSASFVPMETYGWLGTFLNQSLYNLEGFTFAFWYFDNGPSNRVLWQGYDWTMSLEGGRPAWGYLAGDSYEQIVAPQAINPLDWNHLALSYNAQNRKYSFYLNGQLIESTFGEIPTTNNQTVFHHRNDSLSFEIDNLAIYLTELNSADVRTLFSNEVYLWSTGVSTNILSVFPENTTTYSCTITDEFYTCTASATIEVVVEDSDEDGVCNARDYCAVGPEVGDFCSDGDPCTLIDIVQPDCSCLGIAGPDEAFTLTPSAEKVCGGDSAYFTITGPPLAMVEYSLNGEPASIVLDASGLGVLGISPPQNFNTLTPDTVIIELRSYEIPGTELCDTLLSIIDSIIHYGGFEPTIVTKWTDGLDDCGGPYGYAIGYEINLPYLSTLYYTTNYPIDDWYQENPYTHFDSVYNFYFQVDYVSLANMTQNSNFVFTLDSIDYGGCVTQLYDIADTTAIPSQRFWLSDSYYGVPIENGVRRAGCDYTYAGSYASVILLQQYDYGNFAFPAESEYWWNNGEYEPNSFGGFDFEFEINGTTVHFNNFQYDYNFFWYDVLSDAVTLEGTTYVFSLGSDYDDGEGPSLYILAGGDYDLINDTVEVRLVAATGPDGCRQTDAGYYFNNGAAVTYIINPIETLPSESITISCADEASNLVGIDVSPNYWGGGGNAWSNQPDFYNTENLFLYFYWTYYLTEDTLLINQPGNYYLFSRDVSTCQYYQKEFIVTANAGAPCDDGNPCTIDDVYGADCLCAGTYIDSDGDGVCDGQEVLVDPLIVVAGNETLQCSLSQSFLQPVVSGGCPPYSIGYSDVVAQTGICGSTVERHWTVSDNCGNSVSDTSFVVINDTTAPLMTNVTQNKTYDCTYTGAFDMPWPTVTDNCDSNVELDLVIDTIAGSCSAEYTLFYRWTATDDCGNDRVVTRTVSIVDNAGPVFNSGQQQSYEFLCGNPLATPAPLCSDVCSEVVSIISVDGPINYSSCGASFTRVWTATDACGNTRTFPVLITWIDENPPVPMAAESFLVLSNVSSAPPISWDDCSANVTSTTTILSNETDACGTLIVESHVATDPCGYTAEFVRTIRIPSANLQTLLVESIAPNETYVFNGQTIQTAGTYTAVLESFSGCDSLVTLQLSVNQGNACEGFTASAFVVQDGYCGGSAMIQVDAAGGTAPYSGTGYFYEFYNQGMTYTVTDANGCTAQTDPVYPFYTTYPDVYAYSTTGNYQLTCAVDSILLQADVWNVSCGYELTWYDESYAVVGYGSSIYVTEPGTYYARALDWCGCEGTSTVWITQDVTVPIVLIDNFESYNQSYCGPADYCLQGSGATSYEWFVDGVSVSNLNFICETSINFNRSYALIGVGSNGCVSQASAFITILPEIGISPIFASNNELNCDVNAVTLSVLNFYPADWSIYWSSSNGNINSTGTSIQVNEPGQYWAFVSDGYCSSVPSFYELTEDFIPPVADIINVSGSQELNCSVNAITLSASGGIGYEWSNGLGNNSVVTITTAGLYTVTVTGANGCVAEASITITSDGNVPDVGIVSLTGTAALTCETTSIDLLATGGGAIEWSNALGSVISNSANLSVSEAGIYTATVTSASGCQGSASLTITDASIFPEISIQNNTSANTLTCDVTEIVLTVTGGASYVWSTGETSSTIVIANPGSYTVTGTAANGCTGVDSFVITQDLTIPNITISASSTVLTCNESAINVTASGASFYSWNGGLGNTANVTITAAGTYAVTGSELNGCSDTQSITITSDASQPVEPTPVNCWDDFQFSYTSCSWVNIGSQPMEPTMVNCWDNYVFDAFNCAWVNIGVQPAQPVAVYCWDDFVFDPASCSWYNQGTQPQDPTPVNCWDVWVFDEASCVWLNLGVQPEEPVLACYEIATFNTATCLWDISGSQPEEPIVECYESAAFNEGTCQWEINGSPSNVTIANVSGTNELNCLIAQITLIAEGAVAYSWNNGLGNSASVNISQSGIYTVTGTAANGCVSSASVEISIDANSPNVVITASSPEINCVNPTVTLIASGASDYQWTNSLGSSAQVTVDEPGVYAVVGTNPNGCSATASFMILENLTAEVYAGTDAQVSVCTSQLPINLFASLGASVTTGGNWQGPVATGGGYLGSLNPASLAAGTYLFTYSVGAVNSLCGYDEAFVQVVVDSGIATTISYDGPYCVSETTAQLPQLIGPAGGSFSASPAGLSINTAGAIVPSLSAPGIYQVTYTPGNTGACSAAATATVLIDQNPIATITAVGQTVLCPNTTLTLTASSGASYLWNTGATSASIQVDSPGQYQVEVTNSSGCSSTSAPTNITNAVVTQPTIAANGPTTFCEGLQLTLTSSAGSAYQWSSGGTTQTISVVSTGDYFVTVTNASGCQLNSNTIHVEVFSTIDADILPSGSTDVCEGQSVTLSATPGDSYLWSNGATSSTINVTESGNYTVTVSAADGCSGTAESVAVVVTPYPNAIVSYSGSTSLCGGNSVTLTVSQAEAYSWSNGATTQSITVSEAGTYSVTTIAGNNCSATSSLIYVEEVDYFTFYVDSDLDGFGDSTQVIQACSIAPGLATMPGDCNDSNNAISPEMLELCDGIDNNCDEIVDESCGEIVQGCTNPEACNFDPSANEEDGSCVFPGCTVSTACNYDSAAGCDDGSCVFGGCMNPQACNYDATSSCDDGTCVFGGCTDSNACNFDSNAGCDDGSCVFGGCTDIDACNYDANASCDDGSCAFLATYAIMGTQLPIEFGEYPYAYPATAGSTYQWSATGGVVLIPNDVADITVAWANPGIGQICVLETNVAGCEGEEVCLDVVVQTEPSFVASSDLEDLVSIQPNPTRDQAVLSAGAYWMGGTWQILNAQGQLLEQGALLSSQTRIAFAGYASGLYFVRVLDVQGHERSLRIVKEH